MTLKLYMHPVSTASRPVRLFIAEKKLPVEEVLVDLMTGEHHQPDYVAINPNKLVPALVDGDLRLTESAAILKYLAGKFDLPEYPKDLKARAKVDEVTDWFNTQLYREYGYHLCYPQIFPNHKRPTEDAQKAIIQWGKERAEAWLKVLDEHYIGSNPYVAGSQITVADYFGACLVTMGETIRNDLSHYKNISRWIGNMKKLDSWNSVNEALHGFTKYLESQSFEAIRP